MCSKAPRFKSSTVSIHPPTGTAKQQTRVTLPVRSAGSSGIHNSSLLDLYTSPHLHACIQGHCHPAEPTPAVLECLLPAFSVAHLLPVTLTCSSRLWHSKLSERLIWMCYSPS